MNPLALFTGPYALFAKWGVIAALVLSFGAFSWFKGNEHGTAKLTEYQGKQAVATLKVIQGRAQVVHDVQIKYEDRIQTVEVNGDTIIKEVTTYVTKADDADCTIPVGFVREYAAAWTNATAGSASELDRRPSGIPLSAVAETDAYNAKSCYVYKEQRDGLIEFYRKLQDVK